MEEQYIVPTIILFLDMVVFALKLVTKYKNMYKYITYKYKNITFWKQIHTNI